jgi:hypothetical protein
VVAPLLTDRVVVTLVLKDAVTPLGRPEADSATVLLKPFCGVTVMGLRSALYNGQAAYALSQAFAASTCLLARV